MPIRLIILGALVAIAYFLVRNYLRRTSVAKEEQNRAPTDTVKCVICGTHVAKTAAIERNGRYFCSEAHSRESVS